MSDLARRLSTIEFQVSQPDDDTATLFRAIGPEEYRLVEQLGSRAFPPRAEQKVFYPVLTEAFAVKIAHEWIIPAAGAAYITRFRVRRAFLARYPVEDAVGKDLQEYWIPAEDLPEFNKNIVGLIEVIRHFRSAG